MRTLTIITIIIGFYFNSYGQDLKQNIQNIELEISNYNSKIDSLIADKEVLVLNYLHQEIKTISLPRIEEGEELIEHKAMMLVYSEKHEQAKWVAHIISTEILKGSVGRTNDFREDELIKTGTTVEKDYFLKKKVNGKVEYDGFGYDRGHLAPSADFKWSEIALSESYFYSNMSPQLADFNREGWAKLEGMLRGYVYENKVPLFIVTGPILTDDLKKIERSINKVSIPKYFYKVAYDEINKKAISFLIPHTKLDYPIEYYAISIDSLEDISGIDFFANINKNLETEIEKQTDYQFILPKKGRNDIVPMKDLSKKTYNTVQARKHVDSGKKISVCGTIVSTHKSRKGHVFINLDKSFPNQIFSVTIWASNIVNFTYKPEDFLTGKKVCVTGKVVSYKGTPSIYVENEKQIEILE